MKFFSVLFLILLICSPSFAQYKDWSQMVTFDAAYGLLKGEYSDNSLDGYAFDFSYEQTSMDGRFSGGVLITYLRTHDDKTEGDKLFNYESIPILVQGKFLFGPPKFKGYLQGAGGIQFSNVTITSKDLSSSVTASDAGWSFLFGAGAYAFLSEKIFINAAYNYNWLQNSYYQEGAVHLFKLGIGFQFD